MEKEPISIFVATDNFFAVLTAVFLKSLDTNHKTDEIIHLYIVDDGLSEKSRRGLQSIPVSGKINMIWISSKEVLSSDVSLPLDNTGFPLTVYLRVFAPHVINKNASKLIFMDVDMIVTGEISKLWHTSLEGNIIGAVQDPTKTVDCPWAGINNYKELGLAPDTKYFNAGILLIDPVKWREEDKTKEILEVFPKYREHVRMGDQYGLNVVFANKWLELDSRWNWFAQQDDKATDPFVVHFLDGKPIFKNYASNPAYQKEFFRYLALTPWKNYKPISGKWRLVKKGHNIIKKLIKKLLSKGK